VPPGAAVARCFCLAAATVALVRVASMLRALLAVRGADSSEEPEPAAADDEDVDGAPLLPGLGVSMVQ
jgi:hypothetical protein